MLASHEVYTRLEAYLVEVTTQHGTSFVCRPLLLGFYTGAQRIAELTGVTRAGEVESVFLSRDQLDRGAQLRNNQALKLYDENGVRVALTFFEPVEYIGT